MRTALQGFRLRLPETGEQMNDDILELRQIAADAKDASPFAVKPILERFADRAIDQIETLTVAVERLQEALNVSQK